MKTKIFLSWSGERSKQIADIFYEWIPCAITATEAVHSEHNIPKGKPWFSELSAILEQCKIGIICLTPENLNAPWILFEAGSLSKALAQNYVCPFLFDLKAANVTGPLAEFQMTTNQKDDIRRLLNTINKVLGDDKLSEKQFSTVFETWWPKLEEKLKRVPPPSNPNNVERTERDMLEEVLILSRSIAYNGKHSRILEDMAKLFAQDFASFLHYNALLEKAEQSETIRKLLAEEIVRLNMRLEQAENQP